MHPGRYLNQTPHRGWLRTWCVAMALLWLANLVRASEPAKIEDLWSLKPLVRPAVPPGCASSNPIDAFIHQALQQSKLTPFPPADRLTWLRRVCFDLTGLPPTIEQQRAFLEDNSTQAIQTVVDSLLASEQHGVRYARHWLDVLRYADVDEDMPAAPGIYLWRDWVIGSLNQDLPYDQFVRAQILGNRAAKRRTISPEGHLTTVVPRPEDVFALGFLARGATSRDNSNHQLAISAVETVSSAFLGMTVTCAKCHDHFFDPISQGDFFAMKAVFDPLALRKLDLATPQQVFEYGRAVQQHQTQMNGVAQKMRTYIRPYHDRLYEERLQALPPEAQAAIRKSESARTAQEQKIADDYYPILRIDPSKIKQVMPKDEIPQYEAYLKQIKELKAPEAPPEFWTVHEDAQRLATTNYVFNTGNPERPILSQPAAPGFPFSRGRPEFREGRRETFVDWLTAPENPLFARVAVNRVWQWHFGTGLHTSSSDFGSLGGKPTHPELLDWLASEFIAHGYSMKWLHSLVVTSETYRRDSAGRREIESSNQRIDPGNVNLWKFPLRRLEAEPIRDSLLMVSGRLDLTVGGKSFRSENPDKESCRRTLYMTRGYKTSQDVMPDYLQTFDAEDGRSACPRRNQTVTAPQALFMMNNELARLTAAQLGERLTRDCSSDLGNVVNVAYQTTLGRSPTDAERTKALAYLGSDPSQVASLAWVMLNLDEFIYVR